MVIFTSDTYEKVMYEKILAHQYCTQRFGETGDEREDDDFCEVGTAIEIANYHDGENVAIECVKCNEVIIDFDKPGEEN
tara:strand:+ start:63 stop:299 length:237 start_codon:yes stop_codon:yes gene_type:complete